MNLTSFPFTQVLKRKWDPNAFKAFFSIILGTVVEYYDYALYGFCAHLLATQFFPNPDPTVALLKAFGVFLFGSLAKPLGALIFGYVGDRFGRRVSLKISMMGIAIPTVFIGCMPTYADIGWLAPGLLLGCRILQGIFTAGESDGVRIFIFESFFKTKPCFANSLSNVACMLGIYLASVVSSSIMSAKEPTLLWRLPFLFGGMLGVVVYWVRRMLPETTEFIQYQETTSTRSSDPSFISVLIKNKRLVVAAIFLCGASGGRYHFYFVFLANYLSHTLKIIDPTVAAFYNSQAILLYTLFSPLAGLIADHLGLIRIFKFSFYGLLLVIGFNIGFLFQDKLPLWVMGMTAAMLASFSAPVFPILLERLSIGERYRCLSLGHSLGSMIFSGSAPLVSLWLWHFTHHKIAPFLYFTLLSIVGFVALFLVKKR